MNKIYHPRYNPIFQESKGYEFESETDTETIAKLIKYVFDNRETEDITFSTLVERVIQQLLSSECCLHKHIFICNWTDPHKVLRRKESSRTNHVLTVLYSCRIWRKALTALIESWFYMPLIFIAVCLKGNPYGWMAELVISLTRCSCFHLSVGDMQYFTL